MKSRDYKFFRSGNYYHVFNRGNNRQNIFLDEQDYDNFYKRLKLVLSRGSDVDKTDRKTYSGYRLRLRPFDPDDFDIVCYCLMPNHFHFLIRQNGEAGIDKLMLKICTSYASYFNKKHERIGHIFQDNFKAKHVDSDAYVKILSAYIHLNPDKPFNYQFSSLPDFLGRRSGKILDKKILLSFFQDSEKVYFNFLKNYNDRQQMIISHLLFSK